MSIIEIPAVRVNAQELFFEETPDGIVVEKYCSKCGKKKPVSEFYSNTRHRSGYLSQCKECMFEDSKMRGQNEKRRQVYHSRKDQFDRMVMRWGGGGCAICGQSEFIPRMYQWHHLDPTFKEEEMARLRLRAVAAWSQKKFEQHVKNYLAEASKCVLLCANCHAKVHHYIDLQKDVPDEFKRFLPEAA